MLLRSRRPALRLFLPLLALAGAWSPIEAAGDGHEGRSPEKHSHEGHDHEGHDHGEACDHETNPVAPAPTERLRTLESFYEIRREGGVQFEQRFRLGVAGAAIRRGPLLNYLTVFRGPGGLILETELEILEVLRDGRPEPFRSERRDGILTVYVGSADHELEHRVHEYVVKGRSGSDWRRGEDGFTTTLDILGSLPALPVDQARVEIRLPEGVSARHFSPAVTGARGETLRHGPPFESATSGNLLRVHTTAPLEEQPSFFVNLSWPSEGFATRSQWPMVLRQHPRLPLSAVSALLLLWALGTLVSRAARRRARLLPAAPANPAEA